jgi:hypothetical protein
MCVRALGGLDRNAPGSAGVICAIMPHNLKISAADLKNAPQYRRTFVVRLSPVDWNPTVTTLLF